MIPLIYLVRFRRDTETKKKFVSVVDNTIFAGKNFLRYFPRNIKLAKFKDILQERLDRQISTDIGSYGGKDIPT